MYCCVYIVSGAHSAVVEYVSQIFIILLMPMFNT